MKKIKVFCLLLCLNLMQLYGQNPVPLNITIEDMDLSLLSKTEQAKWRGKVQKSLIPSFANDCTPVQLTFNRTVIAYGRTVVASRAFEDLLRKRMRLDYVKCTGDPYNNYDLETQINQVLAACRAPKSIRINCTGGSGNASTSIGNYDLNNVPEIWWGQWFQNISQSPCIAAGTCTLQPYAQAAGIIWHEMMHQFGFGHGANDQEAAKRNCGIPSTNTSWNFQYNTIPYIVEQCIYGVLLNSQTACGDIRSCPRPGQLKLLDRDGGNTCSCVNDPVKTWSGWNYLSNTGDKAKKMVIVPNRRGKLHAFRIGMDDQLWHNDESSNGSWSGWHVFSNRGNKGKDLIVIPNSDGRLHAFMIGMDDQVWHNDESINGSWTGWQSLGGAGTKAKKLVVAPNRDGSLHAFMIGMDDQIWHSSQSGTAFNSAWSGWYAFSNRGDKGKDLIVVPNSDGRLHAFMIGMDDQVWHNDESINGSWTGWQSLGGAGTKAKKLVVAPNRDGSLHAFMIGMDNQIWHSGQSGTASNSPWSGWYVFSNRGDKGKDLIVVPNSDGRLHAFMIGMDDQVWHNDESSDGSWTSWQFLGGAGTKAKKLVVVPTMEGRLFAFMIGLDNQIWQSGQSSTAFNSTWFYWTFLSKEGDKAKALIVVPNRNSPLHAFMIGMDDQVWHNGSNIE